MVKMLSNWSKISTMLSRERKKLKKLKRISIKNTKPTKTPKMKRIQEWPKMMILALQVWLTTMSQSRIKKRDSYFSCSFFKRRKTSFKNLFKSLKNRETNTYSWKSNLKKKEAPDMDKERSNGHYWITDIRYWGYWEREDSQKSIRPLMLWKCNM